MSDGTGQVTHIKASYLLLVDGFISHPVGEILIEAESWHRLKEFHPAIDGDYINCSSSGGEPDIAKQILASKGARFSEIKG